MQFCSDALALASGLTLTRRDIESDVMGEPGFALHAAASAGDVDEIESLLQAGADVNALDADKLSPLDHAAASGCAATVQLFLDLLPPPSVDRCWSAAGWAARRQHGEVFSTLLKVLESRGALQDHLLYSCPDEARKAVWWVAKRGNVTIAAALLDDCPVAMRLETDGSTMLIVAVMFSQTDMVNFLLDRGADPFTEDSRHENAVTAAARAGSVAMINLLWESTEGAGRLERWNARGSKHPPLCKAAQEGHLQAVQRLLELGLDMETSDADGHTPLYLAAGGGPRCSGVVMWLLSQGASWWEAVQCAVQREDGGVFRTLIDIPGVEWRNPYFVREVVQRGSAVIAAELLDRWPEAINLELYEVNESKRDASMLRLAARLNHVALVQLLVARGARLRVLCAPLTALHDAARMGHLEVVQALLPDPTTLNADRRQKHRALLEYRGWRGHTALHRAVTRETTDDRQLQIVQLLLERELDLLEEHDSTRKLKAALKNLVKASVFDEILGETL
ncbi:hypothetical protein FOCC_FOCC007572 [Frankliniella occidentalis]|nr:hypothetical protein FOCC_FOCC007572 [Frankliniella occidentalis]